MNMWTLVFIYLFNGEPFAVKYDMYESMYECFQQREILAREVGGVDGYYPSGQQGICIYTELEP